MDFLYIGAKYDVGKIGFDDGSAFTSTPCVALYNPSSKRYYIADEVSADTNNTYNVSISATLSATFVPGVYSLEIYTDSEMTDIIYHEKDFVKAVKAAASPDSEN